MTVSNLNISHSYIPGALMLSEALPFQFLDAADIVVTDPAGLVQILGTHYEVNGNGRTANGAIRALVAFGAGVILTVTRSTPSEQNVNLVPGQPLPAESLEYELDRRAMVEQENASAIEANNLTAIKVPIGESGGVLPSATERRGKALSWDVNGMPIAINLGGADGALRTDLIEEYGSDLVTFKHDFPSAIPRPASEKLRDFIHINDTGATGLNDNLDAVRLQSLFDEAAPTNSIFGAPGAYKVGGTGLKMKTSVNLDFSAGTVLRADLAPTSSVNALSIDVTKTLGEVVPSAGGENRGQVLTGGRIFINNTGVGGEFGAGGYGIAINTDATNDHKQLINFSIRNMLIGGGKSGGVVFGKAGLAPTVAWVSVTDCTVSNGITFNGADGEISRNNVSYGIEPAHTFNITPGGFHCGIFGGTSSNNKGGINVINGSRVKVHGLQCEFSDAYGTVNQQAYGAQALVEGRDYAAVATEFIGNNWGAGAYVANTIVLANARLTRIYGESFNISSNLDLYLVNNANPDKDAYGTFLGYDTAWRGVRARKGYGYLTDVQRLANISSSGPLRQPHYGIWFPLFDLLTDKASDLVDGLFEAMIDHSGRLAIQGQINRTVFFANGLSLGKLPLWMMPARNQFILVHGQAGEVATLFVNVATGELGLNSNGLAASTALIIPSSSWMAVVNPTYLPGE